MGKSPVKKFATVKIIVFIGVWQRLSLSVLSRLDLLPHVLPKHEAVALLNNYFMCLETFVLGFINLAVFSAVPPAAPAARGGDGGLYQTTSPLLPVNGEREMSPGLGYFLSLSDVWEEVRTQLF